MRLMERMTAPVQQVLLYSTDHLPDTHTLEQIHQGRLGQLHRP